MHDHFVGVDGTAAGCLAYAERVECGKGIGAKLNASAVFAKLRRLLEHLD